MNVKILLKNDYFYFFMFFPPAARSFDNSIARSAVVPISKKNSDPSQSIDFESDFQDYSEVSSQDPFMYIMASQGFCSGEANDCFADSQRGKLL
jgi:hypothetical protein